MTHVSLFSVFPRQVIFELSAYHATERFYLHVFRETISNGGGDLSNYRREKFEKLSSFLVLIVLIMTTTGSHL